ncbi:putative glyoxalase superfamily protein PhnB [Algoriphagus ratkowskyi]|uniref:Putative glyoxalase superfamily protein PhnB n=1 Tax=Algoriphagus ratkowskyi TaxID=57028 RepID=A0A2W7RM32_9BACT|nr:VOC family protein [Algoriphagus ratkowskyi]PZX61321.1 putative glyoxalase superfamily protein PhnB [Algoriphagus ratkowskyi]TXD79427.1 VOC family protein [Algoriphagus ratkowskyi]
MKFEHFALNVNDASAASLWYEENLGLKVVKKMTESPFMTFLADDSGTVMLEIYTNPKGETLDFDALHPLAVHLALVSEDPTADRDRLVEAGARVITDDVLPDGSQLVMLKDPWGVALQLCRRATPMI